MAGEKYLSAQEKANSEGTVAATTLKIFKVAGNDICGTICIKSGIPDRLSLIFCILVSWYPCCFNHIIQCGKKSAVNILFRVNKAPSNY